MYEYNKSFYFLPENFSAFHISASVTEKNVIF